MNRTLITGMGRSGTTLLDKLLSNHQNIEILSQPFPLLFTEAKRAFLKQNKIEKYYVLNDNVFDGDYKLEDFNTFLDTYEISYQTLEQLFEKMKNYSGQMTKVGFNLPKQENYTFLEVFDLILKKNLAKKDVHFFGAKEIMCEEFIPYLVQNGTKIIVIVRDPKDVVASVNYPQKEKYLGNKKPTLFVLRGWRRTIDYIKNLKNSKNITYVRYEDLVTAPYEVLAKVTDFLGTTPFEKNHFEKGIYDRDGELWKANTSFDTKTSFISSKSVGGYRNVLSDDEINYIESICKSEMELMGYNFDTQPNKGIIKTFKDFGVEASEHLDKEFSSLKENIEQEIKRYDATAN
jgi:hypothetical protein